MFKNLVIHWQHAFELILPAHTPAIIADVKFQKWLRGVRHYAISHTQWRCALHSNISECTKGKCLNVCSNSVSHKIHMQGKELQWQQCFERRRYQASRKLQRGNSRWVRKSDVMIAPLPWPWQSNGVCMHSLLHILPVEVCCHLTVYARIIHTCSACLTLLGSGCYMGTSGNYAHKPRSDQLYANFWEVYERYIKDGMLTFTHLCTNLRFVHVTCWWCSMQHSKLSNNLEPDFWWHCLQGSSTASCWLLPIADCEAGRRMSSSVDRQTSAYTS